MTAAPLGSTIAADDPEGSPDAVFVALSPAPTLILTEALGIPVRAQETKASAQDIPPIESSNVTPGLSSE
jgi:hypothetical protein